VSPRDKMLRCMLERCTAVIPEGVPIIPDGPKATTQDIQEFKRLAKESGYAVKFGRPSAVTKPGKQEVEITAECTTGVLADEYLHVWNNLSQIRGHYLRDPEAQEHVSLARTLRLSGSSNDRRFHQLELQNYVSFLAASQTPIPIFVWRSFTVLNPS
jgi:hypothetical protein